MIWDDDEDEPAVRWTGLVFFGVVTGVVIFLIDVIGWADEDPTVGNLVGDVIFGLLIGVGTYKAAWFRDRWRRLWRRPPGDVPIGAQPTWRSAEGDRVVRESPPSDPAP